ncbi:caspase family protein [Rhizobium sp. R693]|uniref:caspase family protein n=1 Tax=Rhizobium sp. R693 TaxID=1764276 RepID=UPI000B533B2D|nr:caspase family protein [Rhizobium sp. R693]OWV98761.1 hypothetical protein ATY79_19045 [Rhizobium sp. R693]
MAKPWTEILRTFGRSLIERLCSLLLTISVLAGFLAPLVARAQDYAPPRPKFALLIGNGDYDENSKFTKKMDTPKGRLTDLKNPCHDIELIEARLLQKKWLPGNIFKRCNATKSDFLSLLADFSQSYMQSSNPFGLIYYAGHGIQIGPTTYVFGVDTQANLNQVKEIWKKFGPAGNLFKGGIRLREEILSSIGALGDGTILIVLDACREDPIIPMLKKDVDAKVAISGPSIAPSPAPVPGIKYLFSTADGQLADDGVGDNSPFAEVFASELAAPGSVKVTDLISKAVFNVYTNTKDNSLPQVPEETGTLRPPPPENCFGSC